MKRMLVGLLLLGMVVSGVACGSSGGGSGGDSSGQSSAYNNVKDELQNAVAAYSTEHQGVFPYLDGTYSVPECTDCHVIDIAALLTSQGGMLREVPAGVYSAAGANNDNCDGGASGCSSNNHYIWIIDLYGNVRSTCMGSDCDSNNASGYQSVWP
jgi:hypothetical protein